MTDAEIAEFMGWSLQASDRMKDEPQSFVGRVHRLVAEVRRREQAKLDALKAEVLPVLQIGLAAASEVAERYHQEMRGYRPHIHALLDDNTRHMQLMVEALMPQKPTSPIEGVPV
jgi:hypothetical protein